MEEGPPQLVFNWDQTGIGVVPGSAWALDLKGSKRVEIVGITDKHQMNCLVLWVISWRVFASSAHLSR